MFLRFPRSLSSVDRKSVHEECERLGLTSTSRGSGSFRSVTVQPRARVVEKSVEKKKKFVVVEEKVEEKVEEEVVVEEEEEIPETMHHQNQDSLQG